MKQDIDRLYHISQKRERRILGLMSGTSIDGLDMALVRISGSGRQLSIELEEFKTVDYDQSFREYIIRVFAKNQVDFDWLCCLNPWIANRHSDIIQDTLNEWMVDAKSIDLLASHGQTVYHAPKQQHGIEAFGNATLQIGDGDHMARRLGIITLSDFRQKHIAAGGEGAPLALYGDYLLFNSSVEDRVLINLGGIANLTYLPSNGAFAASICSDVGPGNTLLDSCAKHYFDCAYDKDALFAKKGCLSIPLLEALKDHTFYNSVDSKTTGPEVFNLSYVVRALSTLNQQDRLTISAYDIMCTLSHFTVWGITHYLKQNNIDLNNTSIYLSGGGAHNPLLIDLLEKEYPSSNIDSTNKLGVDPDAKEAILFAVLANECIAGELDNLDHPFYPSVHMGKVSFPH